MALRPTPIKEYTIPPGRVKHHFPFSRTGRPDAAAPPQQGFIGPPAGSLEPIRPPPRAPVSPCIRCRQIRNPQSAIVPPPPWKKSGPGVVLGGAMLSRRCESMLARLVQKKAAPEFSLRGRFSAYRPRFRLSPRRGRGFPAPALPTPATRAGRFRPPTSTSFFAAPRGRAHPGPSAPVSRAPAHTASPRSSP